MVKLLSFKDYIEHLATSGSNSKPVDDSSKSSSQEDVSKIYKELSKKYLGGL